MVKKLKRLEVEEKLKSLGLEVFTPKEFRDVFNVPAEIASVFISHNVDSGLFIKLRNGFYTLKDSHPSRYFIANKLYEPSYTSSITETVTGILDGLKNFLSKEFSLTPQMARR